MTGNELIASVRAWLARYVVLTPAQTLTLTVWCLHTWLYEQLTRTTPYIELTGVSGSGKTTVMEACKLLSRNGEILNTIRTLYMCRRIEEEEGRITLFVDEAEKLSSPSFGDQRSMLASGYRDGGVHGVSVGKGTVRFRSYAPKMFTSTRTMTSVLHNRCIPIWCERGTPTASLSREYERAEATAADLIQRFRAVCPAASPAGGNLAALRKMGVKLTDEQIAQVQAAQTRVITVEADWLTNERDREIWSPLFSLARTLGVDDATWNELQAASVDLSALRGVERRCDVKDEDEAAAERSYAVRLVQDCRAVVQPGEVLIGSTDLVNRLRALPIGPWRAYQRSGLTEISLAQLLGAFGLEPKQRRVPGKGRKVNAVRGWLVSDLNGVKL